VRSGLERACLFLHERGRFPSSLRALVILSDGQDTLRTQGPLPELDQGVYVLIVAARGDDLGILHEWKDRADLFESPGAAVSYLLSLAEGSGP
jgi:hypothetical protein